jgi:GNAT superfamily N-acetyltransferase
MTNNILIRPFQPGDLESVYELVHDTIDISYRADYSDRAIDMFKRYHSRESILENAPDGHILVAVIDGAIVGTGTLEGAHIRRVFVSPQHQRRGISKLIAAALEKKALAENIDVIDLAAAIGSRTFWESRGFTVEEERFAPSEEERIIRYFSMTKHLNPQA